MARRKKREENIRNITKVGTTSYAVTLPIDIMRRWGWRERQKVVVTADEKKKRIIIEDWEV